MTLSLGLGFDAKSKTFRTTWSLVQTRETQSLSRELGRAVGEERLVKRKVERFVSRGS